MFFRVNLPKDEVRMTGSDHVWLTYLVASLAVQEIGREGILPFSSFLSSNKPFGAPLGGLFTQYFISSVLLFVTPPGDGYMFVLSCMCML